MKSETSVRHPKEEMETKMPRTTQYSSEQSNFYNTAVDYNKESFCNKVLLFSNEHLFFPTGPLCFHFLLFSAVFSEALQETTLQSI